MIMNYLKIKVEFPMHVKIFSAIRQVNRKLLDLSYKANFSISFGIPNGLMVEPSSICNLSCPLCPTGQSQFLRENEFLSFDAFRNAIKFSKYFIEYITFWNYGEPLLNENLPEMVRYASSYLIKTQISTNGNTDNYDMIPNLMKSGLSTLIFSIDTPDEKVYSKYRSGGSYKKLIGNIRRTIEYKIGSSSRTKIVGQYLIYRGNENIQAMINHGKEIGFDEIVIKTIGIGSFFKQPTDAYQSFIPKESSYSRYSFDGELISKQQMKRCSYVWYRMVLCSDGTCLPCCRDQNSDLKLGVVANNKPLLFLWNSKKYRKLRKEISTIQKNSLMCKRCSEIIKREIDPGLVYIKQPSMKKEEFELNVYEI